MLRQNTFSLWMSEMFCCKNFILKGLVEEGGGMVALKGGWGMAGEGEPVGTARRAILWVLPAGSEGSIQTQINFLYKGLHAKSVYE